MFAVCYRRQITRTLLARRPPDALAEAVLMRRVVPGVRPMVTQGMPLRQRTEHRRLVLRKPIQDSPRQAGGIQWICPPAAPESAHAVFQRHHRGALNATSIINQSLTRRRRRQRLSEEQGNGIGLPVRNCGGRNIRRVVEPQPMALFNTSSRLRLDKTGVVQCIGYRPGDTPCGGQHQINLRVFILNNASAS
ncbi:hypothetical protein KCP74_06770 [Salmonella enterica subsp. enterica]|nr:hypothetical protein KCP74_06770 [Salmonella enterica subsp. enterica]